MKLTNRFILFFLVILCGSLEIRASNLTEVLAVTNKILALHFEDGSVQYHGYHQKFADDQVSQIPLNLTEASKSTNYLISSGDDSNYGSGLNASRIGRKSKANGFSRNCNGKWDGQRCNTEYVLEHWIYLDLPQALQRGKSYRIKMGNLASNGQEWTLTFNESSTRSIAIHVNQIGYVPQTKQKYAYLSQWMGDLGPLSLDSFSNNRFHLVRTSDGVEVFSGTISKQKDLASGGPDTGTSNQSPRNNFVGSDVWQCDFSSFQQAGEYRLSVDGLGCSYPFSMGSDVYRPAFTSTCRALYHQRSGIELAEPYTTYTRKAPQRAGVSAGFTLKYTSYRDMDRPNGSENGPESEVRAKILDSLDTSNMWGWYQDAGDWDGYATHAVIPAFLMTAYELAPLNFRDGELNIPESGNGIPDILDEARWLLDFYRRSKGPTGGVAGARVHGDFNSEVNPEGIPSFEAAQEWIIYGEEPVMSYKYAALAAQMAYCLQLASRHHQLNGNVELDQLLQLWRSEAQAEYGWAASHTLASDNVKNERAYAAAWLFKLTHDSNYQSQFKQDNTVSSSNLGNFSSLQWAIWAYVTIPDPTAGIDPALKSDLVQASINYAQQEVLDSIERNRSFRMGGSWYMPVVVGQPTTPMVMPAIIAYELTGQEKYLNAVYTTCDYMLGGNPLNMVWVTGLGQQFPRQVLHLDSWYRSTPAFVPGIVPYGSIHSCDWMNGPNGSCDWNGPWDADFSMTTTYPKFDQWPIHELYFENRYCPPSNEFTVHQNVAPAAAVYGYLSAGANSRSTAQRQAFTDKSNRIR